MTIYVDAEVFCDIVNTVNKSFLYDWERESLKPVSLKKNGKHPYEMQVPIQTIGQFIKKNQTTINLFRLQALN